ncbi:hypothetical protein [Actinoplanes sp. NBRC 103695]|uniref:hypothetical protein n=1 Tax=Actinoplanes sp. NBRC 103695 TaxID=3032202 RepID=UPI0024A4D1AD|nr:hypothetical protein [Actinoplanes sp. NBRC 103695]GLY99849.1 hypothetical protein Acsp02_71020 [Actinoplanes sp. NBRC 103695]
MKTRIILGAAAPLALAGAFILGPATADAAPCKATSQPGAVPIAAAGFIETSPAWVSMRDGAPPWIGAAEPTTDGRGPVDDPITVLAGRGGYNRLTDRGWGHTQAPAPAMACM